MHGWKMMVANQLDIMVVDKQEKRSVVVDVTVIVRSGRQNTRSLRKTKG